jgi:hypothetical protein
MGDFFVDLHRAQLISADEVADQIIAARLSDGFARPTVS